MEVSVGAGAVWMWGGDACVALAGGGRRSREQDEGDASVPSPHIRHPRPYGKTGVPLTYITRAMKEC